MRRRRASQPPGAIRHALRRPRWRVGLAWLGVRWLSLANAAVLFVLAIALLTSPRFRVEQVAVSRPSPSAQAAVTRATQLSQVVGRNIFLVNTGLVAQEVVALPSVRHARVIPRLPNILLIEIIEREPIAIWRAANGAFLVDDQGLAMADLAAPAASPPVVTGSPDRRGEAGGAAIKASEGGATAGTGALLTIHDTTGRELALGDLVDQRAVLAARELVKSLPSFGASVGEVEYSPAGLVLITDGHWRVIVGDTTALNQKLSNFAAIVDLAQAERLNIGVVDLRPKDRPFYQIAS